jgi:hypothetical protein
VFSAATQAAAYQAFDELWATMAPSVGPDPQAVDAARYKLARAIVAVTGDGDTDVEAIKRLALEAISLGD